MYTEQKNKEREKGAMGTNNSVVIAGGEEVEMKEGKGGINANKNTLKHIKNKYT